MPIQTLPALLSVLYFLSMTVPSGLTQTCFALTPDEVVVIANSKARHSESLAEYYMKKRGIPRENLITISTTWHESCEREAYQSQIAEPVREKLTSLIDKKRIRALVTVYGVPLKIKPLQPDFDVQEDIQQLEKELKQKRKNLNPAGNTEKKSLQKYIKALKNKIKDKKKINTRAAVDSELALVLNQEYPLAGWLANPYFIGFKGRGSTLKRDTVLIVARLDGPNPETVRRIIDDTLATEKKGLSGNVCIDARWPRPKADKKLSGYALYDASLHKSADLLKKRDDLRVILDQKPSLFQSGDCNDTALYSGWYSLSRYVDAFTWKPGSIGYHIASGECATLKRKNSQVWCKRMLEEGIAATVGPVNEPYVYGFPLPEIFFDKLSEGYLSLGEAYLVSLLYLSWQTVLIGDPLYQPFKPLE